MENYTTPQITATLDKTLEHAIDILLSEKKYPALRDILSTINATDVAALFERLDEQKLPLLFRLLPKELAAETFVEMDDEAQKLLIHGFSDSELKEVVDELYVDDAVDLIEEMPANVVKRILAQADPDKRKLINEILKYPEDSAGSIMTTEYVSVNLHMTVEEAIKRIRRTGIDKETINTCYVLGKDRKLIGLISIRTLLLAEDNDLIKDIMQTNIISVTTTEDRELVANCFNKYDFISLPVVDDESRMVGIVTIDDAIDVIQEEVTEDIEKMAAMTPSDKPYMKTNAIEIWKQRIPWLLLLMCTATFTSMIISSFEEALASQVILTAFIPMIMGTGGNSGGQSSVTVIRGLSLGEIHFKDTGTIVLKEFIVASLCGITLAIATFIKLLIIDRTTPVIACIVALTLWVTIIFAKVVGCSLPILAKKLHFDPAVMANPFITTIVDAISLIVYFQIASVFLNF